jgi:hypothetical protein
MEEPQKVLTPIPEGIKVRTPCGYAAGPLQSSGGTQYMVEQSGQIKRMDGGDLSKAERKAAKKRKVQQRRRGA